MAEKGPKNGQKRAKNGVFLGGQKRPKNGHFWAIFGAKSVKCYSVKGLFWQKSVFDKGGGPPGGVPGGVIFGSFLDPPIKERELPTEYDALH